MQDQHNFAYKVLIGYILYCNFAFFAIIINLFKLGYHPPLQNFPMNDNIDAKIIKNFDMLKKVGKGAYGQVWKCLNKKTHTLCALKRIFDAFRNSTDCQRTYREIMYLKQLKHNNIVKLFSYKKSQNEKDMYIEMEYIQSDLATALKNQYLRDIQKQYIFTQIVSAIYYLHSGNLIHRDIKPSNILVGANCQAKICDFGLIRSILNGEDKQAIKNNFGVSEKLTDNIATRWYKAPELLLSSGNYGKEIDIWSLGCLLGEMYLGKPIFQGNSTYNQLQKIIQITGAPNLSEIEEVIQSQTSLTILSSIIQKMQQFHMGNKKCSNSSMQASNGTTQSKSTSSLLEYQSSQQSKNQYSKLIQLIPTLQPETSTQDFSSNHHLVLDLLTKILQFDPRKRLTIEQIIQHPYLNKFRNKIQFKKMNVPVTIKYDHIKLNREDYKLLLSGNGSENIEINLNKYMENRNKDKSKEKNNLQTKFVPISTNNDRSNSNSATKTQLFTISANKQQPIKNYTPSKKSYSNYSGYSKRSAKNQEVSPPSQCQSPKAATAANYRVIHLKDSAIVGYNKIVQNHNTLTNESTTYYNINNSMNTTYIQTNYIEKHPQSLQKISGTSNQQSLSPKSSTYLIHNGVLYNSKTFQPDAISQISNISTNKYHIYHPPINTNQNGGNGGQISRSQKSVSNNKSENKSVSGVSCKSYKSNVSHLSNISKVSNITTKTKVVGSNMKASKQRNQTSPGPFNSNTIPSSTNAYPGNNMMNNGLVNLNSTTSQSYKYITKNNYPISTNNIRKEMDKDKQKQRMLVKNKGQNTNYIPNYDNNQNINDNRFKSKSNTTILNNTNTIQKQSFNYRESIQKNLNIIDKIKSDNEIILSHAPNNQNYHQSYITSSNTLPQSDYSEKYIVGETVRTETETNASIITNMQESKVYSNPEHKIINNGFEARNIMGNIMKQPYKNPLFNQPEININPNLKSPFNYHYQPPPLPMKPSSNLNTSINTTHHIPQVQPMMQRYYPNNTFPHISHPNINNNKVNYPYTPHQSHNITTNMPNIINSPFSIKSGTTNGIPQQIYIRMQDNILKIKPNQLRKS